jgi:3-phosphoshikimate 1-carboxyvinyltransferase
LNATAARGIGGDAVQVAQARRLRGRLRVPPDKSISHRALMLAAVAEGESRLFDVSAARDPQATADCLAALGIELTRSGATEDRVDLVVRSPGWSAWRAPAGPLDCANSGTTMRLLAGLLAGSALTAPVRLDGDDSLRGRPMGRVVEPLQAMGADIQALGASGRPPLEVGGRHPLHAIDWPTPVPSAQVKSAILLAGLGAEGRTTVRESVATRDHTERMLRARGVEVIGALDGETGRWRVSLQGGQRVAPVEERVPGDISAAAFWLVVGAAHPDAELELSGVGINPTRRAVIELLRRMGARIDERPGGHARGAAGSGAQGEAIADLTVRSSPLEGIEIAPDEVARAIDEVPVLCLAAACGRGTTHIRGAGELRHKESDRLTAVAAGLGALGARIRVTGDDLTIEGQRERLGCGLEGAEVASLGDHRLAMTFAMAGLIAAGRTRLDGAETAAVSYPGFWRDVEGVRA